jgi:lipopolysaccharide/colanic/teichoic acid biosynthesis glycosyltransferase
MSVSKRVFDLFWTLLGLALLWPLFIVIAVWVKVEDGGPVFFRQERVGHRGQPFRIWKFRTMVIDAEKVGRQITVGQDPRITRAGRWMRKTKLDELPQLLNVLAGEMSLVGPRPEVPKYVALYTEAQRQVLDLVPGITDEASIKYRNESCLLARSDDPECLYIEEIMPAKIALNLSYAQRATTLRDVGVIIRTVLSPLRGSDS